MEYFIVENRFEYIEKKINSIKNKCEKLGLPFKYEVLGEEFRNVGSEMKPVYVKFIKIDVEGRAYISDYEAVAVAECTKNGNVMRKINHEVEIPARYYNSGCICEHCNSDRYRKEVLIIRNVNTGEYKQVGKACCKLYTGNLDAQWVAMLGEFYDKLSEEEQDGMSYDHLPVGGRYYPLSEVVETAYAIIRKCGYFSSNTNMPTKVLTSICMNDGYSAMNKELKFRKYDIEFCGSDFDGVEDYAKKVIEYYESASAEANSDFMRNISIIIKNGYVSQKELGYVCYLPQGYMKEVEKAEQKRITAERRARSNELGYFGEVGKRYKNEKVDSVEEIGYYTTQFGITVIYRITLESGYELTWKASSTPHELEDENMEVDTVTFTVKEHGEYKGNKQTLVTRCRFGVKEKEKKKNLPTAEEGFDVFFEYLED